MSHAMRHASIFVAIIVVVAVAASTVFMTHSTPSEQPCAGHQLLSKRRPEASCQIRAPQIVEAPDKVQRAVIYPADVSLDTTPDMESRVVIRALDGVTVNSKDYSSARGQNGYYVYRAAWSPDAQFFAFSMVSSGGHSPWSYPIAIYSRKHDRFAGFSDLNGGKPTLSGEFGFTGPHILAATTWRQEGAINDKAPITVDLEAAFANLPPSQD